MDAGWQEYVNALFRWIHVVAGILWIGHLWFFNFVNAQLVKTYDADSKKKVVPELMPRALYWFRFGAAYTWVSGLILLGIVIYMGGVVVNDDQNKGLAIGVGFAVVLLAFFVYDLLWKSPIAKNEKVGAAVSFVLFAVVAFALSRIMSGRSAYIHLGSMLGTIMNMNVWMRIWPAQRKIIGGIKGTSPAPDASVAALAGLRSKHNTYMSVPLMFFMVSNHFPTMFGSDFNWVIASVIVAIGWGATKFLYNKSASAAPAQF